MTRRENQMTTEPVTRIELYYAIENAFATPPAHTADLLAAARSHGVRREVIDALSTLPDGHLFPRIRDVWEYYPDMPTGAVGDL